MTHVDSASRAGNATGTGVESSGTCGDCSRFAEEIDAAFVGRKMSLWTDLRVLRTRHVEASHPEQYRTELRAARTAQQIHAEANTRGRWVA